MGAKVAANCSILAHSGVWLLIGISPRPGLARQSVPGSRVPACCKHKKRQSSINHSQHGVRRWKDLISADVASAQT
jgi:hypothetical protein